MKTFIDNVNIQVIESSIVQDLADTFTPVLVLEMESELVTKISSESRENQTKRELLERKRDILRKGVEICKRHAAHRDAGKLFRCKWQRYANLEACVDTESISSKSSVKDVTPQSLLEGEDRLADDYPAVDVPSSVSR